MITVNGKLIDMAGKTLTEYLAYACYDNSKIAVEKNGNIIPKNKYDETLLRDGDILEVVSFVGGG